MSASREQLGQSSLSLFKTSHAAKIISKLLSHKEFCIPAQENQGRGIYAVVADLSTRFPGLFAELMKQWAQRVQNGDTALNHALQSASLDLLYKQIKTDAKLFFEKEPLLENIIQLWTVEERKFIPNRPAKFILALLGQENPFLKICVNDDLFNEVIFPSIVIEQAHQHLVQLERLTKSVPTVMYMSASSIYESPKICIPLVASTPNLTPLNNQNSTQVIQKQISAAQPKMTTHTPENKLLRSTRSLRTVSCVNISRLPPPKRTSYLPSIPEPASVQSKDFVTTTKEMVSDVLTAALSKFGNR